jgi:SPP1 family predicted phage head-tail adaptor
MNAGDLNKRVELQIPTTSTNSMGETILTYTTRATVWAAVEPMSGRLLFEAQQANSQVQGRVRIRYRTDIKPTWRIKYGTRYLEILSIVNYKEANDDLQILYKETID